MFENFKALYDIIVDKSMSMGQRFAKLILIVAILFIADYISKFSYNIFLSNKLDKLESIHNLKTVYSTDSIVFGELSKIETRLLGREHYLDFMFRQASKIDIKSQRVPDINHQTNNVIKTINTPIRSSFWMFISSNYVIIVAFFSFLFYPLYTDEEKNKNMYIMWFAILVLFVLIMTFITWTAYFIPIIKDNVVINYVINAIIHLVFIVLMTIFSNKKTIKINKY